MFCLSATFPILPAEAIYCLHKQVLLKALITCSSAWISAEETLFSRLDFMVEEFEGCLILKLWGEYIWYVNHPFGLLIVAANT